MRSTDQRAALVHVRAQALARQKERKTFAGLSALSLCLLMALTWTIVQCAGAGHGLSPGELTGSSLLADSAGGYVLVAVLSFTAAVAVTTLCFRFQRKQTRMQEKEEAADESKEEAG